jgi:predicted nucleotidyltransferase/DNA-binding XRE family transcriptional regulator
VATKRVSREGPDSAAALVQLLRQNAGLTQTELASRSGTTQAMIARYESGAVSPTLRTLDRIFRECGSRLEVSYLPPKRPQNQALLSGPLGRRVAANRREIRQIVRSAGATNPRVFGSVARGVESPRSDIDIVVTLAKRQKDLKPLLRIKDELSALLGAKVDVVAESALLPKVMRRVERDSIGV